MEISQQLQPNDQRLIFSSATKNERRKHPRYKMNKNVLSIIDDVMAEVEDISGSGILCKTLVRDDKPLTNIDEIELVNCKLGTSVKGIPCKFVCTRKKAICVVSPSTMIVNFSFEFQGLTQNKREQLMQFIRDGGEWNNPKANVFDR